MLGMEDLKIAMRLKARLIEIGVPLVELRVFGSRARGNASPDSDMDVFLLVSSIDNRIRKLIDQAAWECGFEADRVITTVEYTPDQLTNSPLRESPFVRSVLREGVRI